MGGTHCFLVVLTKCLNKSWAGKGLFGLQSYGWQSLMGAEVWGGCSSCILHQDLPQIGHKLRRWFCPSLAYGLMILLVSFRRIWVSRPQHHQKACPDTGNDLGRLHPCSSRSGLKMFQSARVSSLEQLIATLRRVGMSIFCLPGAQKSCALPRCPELLSSLQEGTFLHRGVSCRRAGFPFLTSSFSPGF